MVSERNPSTYRRFNSFRMMYLRIKRNNLNAEKNIALAQPGRYYDPTAFSLSQAATRTVKHRYQ